MSKSHLPRTSGSRCPPRNATHALRNNPRLTSRLRVLTTSGPKPRSHAKIPEPSTFVLAASALVGLAGCRRWKQKATRLSPFFGRTTLLRGRHANGAAGIMARISVRECHFPRGGSMHRPRRSTGASEPMMTISNVALAAVGFSPYQPCLCAADDGRYPRALGPGSGSGRRSRGWHALRSQVPARLYGSQSQSKPGA